MFGFFNAVFTIALTIVHAVESFVNIVVFILTQIPLALAFVVDVVAYLPTYIQSFVLLFAGTCIIFNVLNKGD